VLNQFDHKNLNLDVAEFQDLINLARKYSSDDLGNKIGKKNKVRI
jgi:hypothetical protein